MLAAVDQPLPLTLGFAFKPAFIASPSFAWDDG
jgi:hypothetical protein